MNWGFNSSFFAFRFWSVEGLVSNLFCTCNGEKEIFHLEFGKKHHEIVVLQYTKERMRGPFLVVAPLSTLDHWKRTAEDWTDLNVVLYYDENGRTGRDVLRRAEW